MKALTLVFALSISALAAVMALADDAALKSRAGYIDFSVLEEEYGEPSVSINLGSSLLRLVSAMKHDDPVAEAALRNLESIRVKVFDTFGDTAAANDRMTSAGKALIAQSWEQIVRVRDAGEQVDIYVQYGEDVIHGIAVMAVDGEDAVFINILGDINPQELSMVMNEVDLDLDIDLDL